MSRKILIAEDSRADRELYTAFLAGMECEIEIAEDGKTALDKARMFLPDVILLDIMLPEINGFDICKTLKEEPSTRKIVILMITALDDPQDVIHAVDVHADDYLTKPVNREEFVKRVERNLKLKAVRDQLTSS